MLCDNIGRRYTRLDPRRAASLSDHSFAPVPGANECQRPVRDSVLAGLRQTTVSKIMFSHLLMRPHRAHMNAKGRQSTRGRQPEQVRSNFARFAAHPCGRTDFSRGVFASDQILLMLSQCYAGAPSF